MSRPILVISFLSLSLASCAGAQATRTSQNTLIIDASTAPACGRSGTAKVAAASAAIETIRAGYGRYMITGQEAADNVIVSQLPGRYNSYGTATYGGGRGTFETSTTYTPGPTIISGGHDRALSIVMFKSSDPGFESAIDAREALGPDWAQMVKTGVHTCL